jgi:hypothetical protein
MKRIATLLSLSTLLAFAPAALAAPVLVGTKAYVRAGARVLARQFMKTLPTKLERPSVRVEGFTETGGTVQAFAVINAMGFSGPVFVPAHKRRIAMYSAQVEGSPTGHVSAPRGWQRVPQPLAAATAPSN